MDSNDTFSELNDLMESRENSTNPDGGVFIQSKPNSINEENGFYEMENNDMDFMLQQNSINLLNNQESLDRDNELLYGDLPIDDNDDNCSEIIQLNTNLNLNLTQESIIDLNEDQSDLSDDDDEKLIIPVENLLSPNEMEQPEDVVYDILYELIDRIDRENSFIPLSINTNTVSRILIEKISENGSQNRLNDSKNSSFGSEELNNLNLTNSKYLNPKIQDRQEDLPVILEVNRPRQVGRKRRPFQSFTNNSRKSKSDNVYDPEIILTQSQHDDPIIEDPFDTSDETDLLRLKRTPQPIQNRIRRITTTLLVKEVQVVYVREYFDSNMKIIKSEQIDQASTKDIIQKVQKEKVLSKNSTKKQSQNDLDSSSSINIVTSDDEDKPKTRTSKKSHKLALSNRYETQDDKTESTKKPRRVKQARTKKTESKSEQKKNNFNFSNLRFKLTPEERNKDLEELNKNSEVLVVGETLNQAENVLDNFLVEFGNEIVNLPISPMKKNLDKKLEMRTTVDLERLSHEQFEHFYQKYKDNLNKPKNKFIMDEIVFVPNGNLYLPAIIVSITHVPKGGNSSFFSTSNKGIDYLYGIKLVDKVEPIRLNDKIEHLKEDSILKFDIIKSNLNILVYSWKDREFVDARFVQFIGRLNDIKDFCIKIIRNKYKKIIPFQFIAFHAESLDTNDKNVISKQQEKQEEEKTPSKRFSYVNKSRTSTDESLLFDESDKEEEQEESPKKKRQKSDDEDYHSEVVQDEDDDYYVDNEEIKKPMKRKRRIKSNTISRTSGSSIKINKIKTNSDTPKSENPTSREKSPDPKTHLTWTRRSVSNSTLLSDDSLNLTTCRAAVIHAAAKESKSDTITRKRKLI
ncbi:unnamed protein product [Brachionus calyciflorus]|uniref:Uncharacterized protein n=1 Tax=Brachionus calyciflorus TaxID=104777 RepID=A0A813V4E3_9BILA|nr:unnamed protein product [Brachionus calyciflorus]